MKEKVTKILARYYSDLEEKIVVETLWAEIIDEEKGLYKVDNIPFYGPQFSADDIIFAEYDKDEDFLTFKKVINPSGNSTIQIIIPNEDFDTENFLEKLREIGTETEKFHSQFVVCSVLKNTNFQKVKNFLEEYQKAEKIFYAEPHISEKHMQEIL